MQFTICAGEKRMKKIIRKNYYRYMAVYICNSGKWQNKSAAGEQHRTGKKVIEMKEIYCDALHETHTAIDVDTLSEEQLYRRLSEGFDPIAIPRQENNGR
jgi:hypothetical protein